MKTEYDLQAEKFMNDTNTTMEISFLKFDFHFHGDKEKRDIYKVTIKRGSRSFTFNFGNSIVNSGFYFTMGKKRVEIDRKYLNHKNLCSLIRSEGYYDFLNNGKSDIIHKPVSPTYYSILACLTKYDPGTFVDFCSEFGYDTDSKTADKTYLAVMEEYKNICSLYSDEELEQLQEIN